MKRKRMFAMLLSLAMSLTLTACGDGGASGGDNTITVNIWDNNQVAGLRQIAEEWSAKSGVDVRIDVIAWDEYWTLLEAGASGGEMPDVFWMHINEAEKYMAADALLDLTPYIEADESIDMGNYYPGIVELYNYDGKQYAVPKDHDTIAVLYNKSIFDKYGVSYPSVDWTWDDYAAAAAEITEKGKADGVYGTAMNTNDGQDGWYNLIYDFGGKLISDDRKTSGMDDPKTIQAMKWLAENLFPSMPDQSSMAETNPDVLFQSGLVGMMMQGSWMVNTFYQDSNAENYAWSILPYYDANGNSQCDNGERTSQYNGLGWAASPGCDNPQAAYDLIAAFTSKEGQVKQAELGVTMAAYTDCSDAFVSAFEGMDLSPFLDIEKEGTLIQHPSSKFTTRWESAFTTGLIDAWNDPSSMESVCRALAEEMNAILAEE